MSAGRAGTDFPDTGDIIADLNTQLAVVARLFSDDEFVPVYTGLIAAAQSDGAVAAELLETILKPRVEACIRRLERAQADGQVRPDLDPRDVVEALYAGLRGNGAKTAENASTNGVWAERRGRRPGRLRTAATSMTWVP